MPPALMLTLKYVRLGRKDSFISIIAGFAFVGIMLGVATLIVVMSVMNGFRAQLLARILGMNGHVAAYYTSPPPLPYQETLQALQNTNGTQHVFPLIEKQVMAMSGGRVRGALVHGITRDALLERPALGTSLSQGNIQDFEGDVVFLGDKLASRLGVFVGDDLTLASSEATETALGAFPRFKKFKVKGLFHFGMNEYDQTFAFMPLQAAQTFFYMPQRVTGFEIFVQNPEKVTETTAALAPLARQHHLHLLDWQQANASFFSVIQVERNVMFLILTLMVMIAAFNVVAGLVMLVKEKSRDIAILRAMGASRFFVGRLFLYVGATVGCGGTLLGVLSGVFIASHLESVRAYLESITGASLFPAEFYFLSQLPSQIETSDVVSIAMLTLFLTLLSSLYPALRASRLNPHQALRFE